MEHTFRNRKTVLSLMALALFVLMPCGQALAGKADFAGLVGIPHDPTVDIMLGKAEMVEISGPVSDILVANPSIVDVMAVRSNRLYLVGTALGDTNIMALDAAGNIVKRLNVHVQMDIEKLEVMLGKLYPNEEVQLNILSDQVVLTGDVSTPSVANSIATLVAQYAAEVSGAQGTTDEIVTNMLSVRGEQQVMLRVKIVEAARSALKDLGVETSYTGNIDNATSIATTAATALGLTAPAQLGVMALTYAGNGFGPLNFLVRALEEEGIVNTLAEPNLTAISGEQAGFLAGGEFPISTEIDRNGNLVYEFRPFGVSLNFRPIVMSSNRINLELTTEVSTTSFEQNLQLNGINVPTFNVRRAKTTVELPSGGTLMIAGLLESNTISGLTQLPGVGDVPVLGDLLKSDTFQRDESELVVVITPYLVEPFAQNNSQEQDVPEEPSRESSQMTGIFGNNIRRTYGASAPEDLLQETGSFGYIID